MQTIPRCWVCSGQVENDPIFEAPFEFSSASVVFHPLCLMSWRDRRDSVMKAFRDHTRENGDG